jgi:hypothetical protein
VRSGEWRSRGWKEGTGEECDSGGVEDGRKELVRSGEWRMEGRELVRSGGVEEWRMAGRSRLGGEWRSGRWKEEVGEEWGSGRVWRMAGRSRLGVECGGVEDGR